jgi:hypothetical protein
MNDDQERTLRTTPADATHWSIRSMAAETGFSHTECGQRSACSRTEPTSAVGGIPEMASFAAGSGGLVVRLERSGQDRRSPLRVQSLQGVSYQFLSVKPSRILVMIASSRPNALAQLSLLTGLLQNDSE